MNLPVNKVRLTAAQSCSAMLKELDGNGIEDVLMSHRFKHSILCISFMLSCNFLYPRKFTSPVLWGRNDEFASIKDLIFSLVKTGNQLSALCFSLFCSVLSLVSCILCT